MLHTDGEFVAELFLHAVLGFYFTSASFMDPRLPCAGCKLTVRDQQSLLLTRALASARTKPNQVRNLTEIGLPLLELLNCCVEFDRQNDERGVPILLWRPSTGLHAFTCTASIGVYTAGTPCCLCIGLTVVACST